MTITARPYRGEQDLREMESILIDGRQAAQDTYYVHVGDLRWWLFYTDENSRQNHICLWEINNRLAGWSLLSTTWRSYDVFVRPAMRGRVLEAKIRLWAEEHLIHLVRPLGGQDVRTMWVHEQDTARIQWLEMRGFERSREGMLLLGRRLDEPLPEVKLPQGYLVRNVAGKQEVRLRAAASHGAFGSSRPFDDYHQRMQRFMASPVYHPDLDLVTVAPDGHFASFCIIWPEPINKTGLFEPVGTHPDFQHKGLGKAVILEGLKRLKAQGMLQAIVCTEDDNLAAQRLYESAGFRVINKLYTFKKAI